MAVKCHDQVAIISNVCCQEKRPEGRRSDKDDDSRDRRSGLYRIDCRVLHPRAPLRCQFVVRSLPAKLLPDTISPALGTSVLSTAADPRRTIAKSALISSVKVTVVEHSHTCVTKVRPPVSELPIPTCLVPDP